MAVLCYLAQFLDYFYQRIKNKEKGELLLQCLRRFYELLCSEKISEDNVVPTYTGRWRLIIFVSKVGRCIYKRLFYIDSNFIAYINVHII